MTLEQLKEWINSLPEEFLEFEVVICETGDLDEEHMWRLDSPIDGASVDEENREICIFKADCEEEDETTD